MKSILILLFACLLAPGSEAAERKPNILFIFLDDFGWRDTGFMGSDFYETPHLDALAGKGLVFTHAYSSSANCAPARACLLSGQYTPRHEIFNVGTGPRGKAKHRRLNHIPGTDTLRTDIKTWAACLKGAGYTTASMGKWHLSEDPLPYGFDVNVGGSHSGSPPRGYYPPHPNVPGLKDAPKDEYLTDRLTEESVEFIEENRERPWMLYLTHFAVHTPLNAKKELVGKYEAKKPGTLHNHVAMATMIQSVDDGVGKIMATLDRLKLRDDTVIFFFSDNGGYGPATDMAPLKGYKGTYYEGGIRVPFFVNWPGVVKPGRTDVPMIGVDLYPTFCDISGAERPKGQALDGVSLVPFLKGKGGLSADRALFWHFPAYLQAYAVVDEQPDPLFRARPCSVVRKGDWKLIQYFEDGRLELFNLKEDEGETNNLATGNPAKRKEMFKVLSDWQKVIGAPIPSEKNPEFDAKVEAADIEKALRKMRQKAPQRRPI